MAEQVPNPQVVRFGTFEVDLRLGELHKNGLRVKLTGQPFQILVLLLEHPGDLVTREQLQRRLWPSDTFVDFDRGLNASINRVREALGDSAENPRFVETLPRRGYRFIAPLVDSTPARATSPAAELSVSPAQTGTGPDSLPVSEASERRAVSRRPKLLFAGVSILAVLAVVTLAVLSRPNRHRNEWDLQSMTLSKVTQSGNAVSAAISPDGHYVVYALREGEKQGLNVRQVATGSDVQILPPEEVIIYALTFSPDANYIDFVRSEKNNPTSTFLYRIPTLGGSSHLVMQAGMDFSTSYSPNGAQFAFLRVKSGEDQVDLLVADADGSNERVLATRPYLDGFTDGTAWSPDGKTIAFSTVESKISIRSVLWAVSVGDGSVRKIYWTPNQIGHLCWLPDGSGLLAPIGNNLYQFLRGQLWFISFPKGQARRITNDLMNYQIDSLSLTQDGTTLVDTVQTRVSELWIAPAGDTTKAKQVTRNDHAVGRFSWTPDGRIVFASGDGNLSGLNSDGSVRTLTANDYPVEDPSVCGDERYIVYSTHREQKAGVWRMDADGSNRTRIADEPVATSSQCSPDGKWVVYVQVPSLSLTRVATTGEKPPEAIANVSAAWELDVLAFSPEGKRIAYVGAPETPIEHSSSPVVFSPSASRPNQLKVIALDAGTIMYHFDWPASAWRPRWAPAGDAIDYILTRNGVSNIWQQRLTGGPPKQVTHFDAGEIFDFEWSVDGKQMALTRGSESSDVILMSIFR